MWKLFNGALELSLQNVGVVTSINTIPFVKTHVLHPSPGCTFSPAQDGAVAQALDHTASVESPLVLYGNLFNFPFASVSSELRSSNRSVQSGESRGQVTSTYGCVSSQRSPGLEKD